MKNKLKSNPFFCSFICFSALVLATAAAAIGLFYHLFCIPEPEGLSPASWPQQFTDDFSVWMDYQDGALTVEKIGLDRLDEYGLWLQVIDESGQEIFAHKKPADYPAHYPASRLAAISASACDDSGYTLFVSSLDDPGGTLCYIVGFPYAVGKYMLYYDGETIPRLFPAARIILILALSVLALLVFGYVLWLSRKLSAVTDGIRKVTLRRFSPLAEQGMFKDVCRALNKMDEEIRRSDRINEETERTRREWIANITHDLKTPLSPVKGYAELLSENEPADPHTVREYGRIILKNISHAERLISDLTLTYQLDSGAAACRPQEISVTRFLRETVIDIVNDPAFSGRDIQFDSGTEKLTTRLDPALFRRAIQNILINALVHNPPDTKVTVSVWENEAKDILISIRDDGVGMDESEKARLFNRYYRGTSTEEKAEGSGLGLAIAGQVIALHGGDILVKSSPGAGTEFLITLGKAGEN